VLVEKGEHLGTLIDYVHLNPFRAGLVTLEDGLENYQWSSLWDYLVPPRKRSGWVEVAQGLAHKEISSDTAVQRKRYLQHLEGVARERGGVPELPEGEERTLQSTLRRGWYFGAEGFWEKLVKRLKKLKGKEGKAHARRSGYTGAQARDHGETEAKRIIRRGLSLAGLKKSALAGMKKGDWRKRVIGRLVRRGTVMPVGWIAEALQMGDPKRTAKLMQADPGPEWGKDWKAARKLFVELAKQTKDVDPESRAQLRLGLDRVRLSPIGFFDLNQGGKRWRQVVNAVLAGVCLELLVDACLFGSHMSRRALFGAAEALPQRKRVVGQNRDLDDAAQAPEAAELPVERCTHLVHKERCLLLAQVGNDRLAERCLQIGGSRGNFDHDGIAFLAEGTWRAPLRGHVILSRIQEGLLDRFALLPIQLAQFSHFVRDEKRFALVSPGRLRI